MKEKNIFLKSDRLRNEGLTIEYKETFNFGSLAKYFKSLMAFANNRGGIIIFGVTNSPREIKGLNKDSQFYKIDVEKIVMHMKECMSVVLDFEMDIITTCGKELGYIKVEELKYKPVICKRSESDVLKEGEIYYRYCGRTETIGYAELRNILEEIKLNERKSIIKNFNAIIDNGPENIQLVNTNTGKIDWGKVPVFISEDLLNNLKKEVKFIESGRFEEKTGDPTIKIIGTVTASKVMALKEKSNVNIDYPYFVSDIAEELGISIYNVLTIIYHLKIKGDPRYSESVDTSKKTKTTKYSKLAFSIISDEIKNNSTNLSNYLKKMSIEYQGRIKNVE